MKFLHLSDLHLGKRVNEFSMLEDQRSVLSKIIDIADEETPDGILIAGDVYDKPVPPAEAVQLFDEFLFRLSERGLQVFVISGNHDSPERIAFGARLLQRSGIHLSPVYSGTIAPVSLSDEYGTVNVFLLPFVKPAHVRRFFPETEIASYTDALKAVVAAIPLGGAGRNILVTHQFVTGGARCDSEEISVGGADNVDAGIFSPFDYVALGHLHSPQNIGKETIRYCGSPLKYSFSEAGQEKSVTVVECKEKGSVRIRTVPLVPAREFREIRGAYMELTSRSFYRGSNPEDYLHVILTDEEDQPDAIGRLRSIYPNIMKLDYDNKRTRSNAAITAAEAVQKAPLALFAELYEKQNNRPMQEAQLSFAAGLIETIREEET